MANKIYKIVDGQYFEGDLYTVTDAANNKKKIVFDPSSVVTVGTVMDAEKFNQFQKNGTFYVNATHSIDGGNSVYTIEDFEDVGAFGLFNGFKLMVDPPNSCVAGAVISFLGSRYTVKKVSEGNLVNLSANDISKGLPFTVVYDNGVFKIQNISYDNKLDKGTVSADYNTAKKIEDKIESFSNFSNIEVHYDGGLDYSPVPLLVGHPKTGYAYNIINDAGRGGEIIWTGKYAEQTLCVGFTSSADNIYVRADGTAGGNTGQGSSYVYSYKKITQ